MRVPGRAGSRIWALSLALLGVAACDDSDGQVVPFASGGGSTTGGVSTGGSVSIPPGIAGAGGALPPCQGPPLRFPLVRYSVADIDHSLDLVFGPGPRLADEPAAPMDLGYERVMSASWADALLRVARARVRGAVAEAQDLSVCEPGPVSELDPECLQAWLKRYGDQLYHRPLTPQQLEAYLVPLQGTPRATAAENALLAMVLSPYFLFRLESAGPGLRISPYEVASRLAHLATRRIPDADLRAVAASGEIYDPAVRLAQLRRLWQTPAGHEARRLQLLEWLGIDGSPNERVSPEVGRDMAEQARVLIDQVFDEEDGSLTALLGSTRVPLNDRLAEHYGLALPGTEQLVPTELDPQLFSGLLSTGAFLSRHTTPSLRGAAIYTSLLCEALPEVVVIPGHDVPAPPAATPRLGIEAAVQGKMPCSSCHALFDPMGFALDAFDDQGRLTGFPTTGSFPLDVGRTVPVSGPHELGETLASSAKVQSCIERRSLEDVTQSLLDPAYVVRELPPAGEPGLPAEPPPPSDSEWLTCFANLRNRRAPSLTELGEVIVQTDLMVTRADYPPRVVALDTSADPVQHAYQEALQLRPAFSGDDGAVLEGYALALAQLGGLAEPNGGGGAAGAGGEPSFGGDAAGGEMAAGGAR